MRPSAENENAPRREPAPLLKAWNYLASIEAGSIGRSKVTRIVTSVGASSTARSGTVVTTESVTPVEAEDAAAVVVARKQRRTEGSDRTGGSEERQIDIEMQGRERTPGVEIATSLGLLVSWFLGYPPARFGSLELEFRGSKRGRSATQAEFREASIIRAVATSVWV